MSPVMVPATDHAPVVRSFDPAEFDVPTGREEEWRFTPLPRLQGLLDAIPATAAASITVDLPDDASAITVERLGVNVARSRDLALPVDRIGACSWSGAQGVTWIRTSAGVSYDHVVVSLGAHAEADVLVEFDGSGVFAGSLEFQAGPGSRARIATVHAADRSAVNVSRVHVRLDRDAQVRSSVISLGGDLVRVNATVEYRAPGGDAELLGLFFADGGQHHEHRIFVDHATPHCRSAVTYKGALEGAGTHTVWIGDVLVRSAAVGIDTYEVNRNLVLSDGARADSVPNLELETGEVIGAGHASATGRFDDEQLFYLRSRGIGEELARVLVVRGFFSDILGRTGIPGLGERVMSDIDRRLGVDELVASVFGADDEVTEGEVRLSAQPGSDPR